VKLYSFGTDDELIRFRGQKVTPTPNTVI